MAKEFKDYNKIYAEYANSFLDYEPSHAILDRALTMTQTFRIPNKYSHEEIREAVYFGEGFENWQKFRVSLKGFSTMVKLARLHYRYFWMDNCHKIEEISDTQAKLEIVRIDNYLNALKRGGQLGRFWEVVK